MKRTAALFLITALVFIFIGACKKSESEQQNRTIESDSNSNSVTWYSYNEGLERAKKEKKSIVIDFYANWCKYCKIMEAETFSDPGVIERLEKDFICVRVYTDRPATSDIVFQGSQLSLQQFSTVLGVRGLPTLVFLDEKETVITKIPGYVQRDVFFAILGYINERCYEKQVNFQDYMEGKKPCNGPGGK